MKKNTTLLIALAIIVVGLFILKQIKLSRPQVTTQPSTSASLPANLALTLPALGNSETPVKIIEFGDYQCPFCKRLFEESEKPIRDQFIATGKVQFYWKDFAFLGEESIWAAEAARCANDQGKFWEYHDLLFDRQGAENAGVFSPANLKSFAAELKIDTEKFKTCLDDHQHRAAVMADTEEGRQLGVQGTPFLFINDQKIEGAYPYTKIKSVIESFLTR